LLTLRSVSLNRGVTDRLFDRPPASKPPPIDLEKK